MAPDQPPRSAASNLGLHCLPITLLEVSRPNFTSYNSLIYQPIAIIKEIGRRLEEVTQIVFASPLKSGLDFKSI